MDEHKTIFHFSSVITSSNPVDSSPEYTQVRPGIPRYLPEEDTLLACLSIQSRYIVPGLIGKRDGVIHKGFFPTSRKHWNFPA